MDREAVVVIFLGIDPGKLGAIAALNERGRALDVSPVPLVPSGAGAREQYDLREIRTLLTQTLAEASGQLFVAVEWPGPMPPMRHGASLGGSLANYNRGVMEGWWWMLAALGISYQPVRPQTWQRVMFQGVPKGAPKQRSIIAAQRLFPDVSLRRTERSRTDDSGFSDALLIAAWGRRQSLGGELFAKASA